jgi:hypothetical protein
MIGEVALEIALHAGQARFDEETGGGNPDDQAQGIGRRIRKRGLYSRRTRAVALVAHSAIIVNQVDDLAALVGLRAVSMLNTASGVQPAHARGGHEVRHGRQGTAKGVIIGRCGT